MAEFAIRPFESIADARAQYELWLAATADLPRAWRSCIGNVEHQLAQADKYPGCRLYAERGDGSLAGYIGTHPPFEWDAGAHGPPSEPLGWAIPFGFPWTHPRDERLEDMLYTRMRENVPSIYAEFQRDIYIQRFRESWEWVTSWLVARGWRLHQRLPLIGREIGVAGGVPDGLALVERSNLSLVAALAADDPTCEGVTLEALERAHDGGWIDPGAFWHVSDRGAFALEARGVHCAVTFFAARPESWDEVLRCAGAKAAEAGAREIYFTIEPQRDADLLGALTERGFGEVDAGVYYVRDAD